MSSVLIVDDDPRVRVFLRRILETAEHQVLEAETAEDGVRCVKSHPPAVAFCDIHMPGANGLWLADQIRNVSPFTALVLATGDADVPPVESLRSGVVAYLVKPLTRPDVVLALDEGLRWSAEATAKGPGSRTTRRLTGATVASSVD